MFQSITYSTVRTVQYSDARFVRASQSFRALLRFDHAGRTRPQATAWYTPVPVELNQALQAHPGLTFFETRRVDFLAPILSTFAWFALIGHV